MNAFEITDIQDEKTAAGYLGRSACNDDRHVTWLHCLKQPNGVFADHNGFLGAARQALTKLDVTWEPSEAERDYNEGRSIQIPLNPVVRVKGRFSRRLRDGKQELVLAR
jgi:hypothetical protein